VAPFSIEEVGGLDRLLGSLERPSVVVVEEVFLAASLAQVLRCLELRSHSGGGGGACQSCAERWMEEG
jgi:hypothetical protein